MVARMMRWRPWSPPSAAAPHSRAFEVRLVLRRVDGVRVLGETAMVATEVAWKGAKARLRRGGVKRNVTRDAEVRYGGFGVWDEEFSAQCVFVGRKDGSFHPWEIDFTVFFTDSNQAPKKKMPLVGMASLNLADLVSKQELDVKIPLLISGSSLKCNPSLQIALRLLELRTAEGSPDALNRIIASAPSSPLSDGFLSLEKDEHSSRAKFRKVKLFGGLVSSSSKKDKAFSSGEDSEGRCSRNAESEPAYPCDTDSLNSDFDEDVDQSTDDSTLRRSFNYGCLRSSNSVGSLYLRMITDQESQYVHETSEVSYASQSTSYTSEQHGLHTQKKSILPWRKRNLGFRSLKSKGEPLLKKTYGEEGGDDIDFDRRQLSSFDKSVSLARFGGDHFGDDHFSVGSWEVKDFVSRDGSMKLSTQVFFASIDQRSERAAGESACAVLVAVMAEWFQVNKDTMPTRSEFDNLIREGSLEWRKLCENQIYRECFPDKHFDLETVLEAKIRLLSVAPDKSFVGFFMPESTDDNSFDFLNGAMSFDNIWDEISCIDKDVPQTYIVGWNDHFFILVVEKDAYYIIDTLGERLHEGCNQAYILKFDDNTSIHRILSDEKLPAKKLGNTRSKHVEKGPSKDKNSVLNNEDANVSAREELVCRGKDACKAYIKSFLAAIPIRDLQVDLKKGLTSMSVHRRLQIEFHSTELLKETSNQLTASISTTVESDSEFSLPTESDADSSPEPTWNFSWPVEFRTELSWPSEPMAPTSLFAQPINFGVKVN